MTVTPTLAMPDFNEPFTNKVDAFGAGIGAVLTQSGKLVAYMTHALGVAKQSWSIYAKEMLTSFEAIWLWRPYLLGKFFITIDQNSLKYFLDQWIATPKKKNGLQNS